MFETLGVLAHHGGLVVERPELTVGVVRAVSRPTGLELELLARRPLDRRSASERQRGAPRAGAPRHGGRRAGFCRRSTRASICGSGGSITTGAHTGSSGRGRRAAATT